MKPDRRVCLYSFRPTDRYIGYLPLAHIMEMVCGESCKGIEVNLHYQNDWYLQWRRSGVFLVNFENILQLFLVFL